MFTETTKVKAGLSISFWIISIILILFLGFLGPVWLALLPASPFNTSYNLGQILCHTGLVSLPYFLALILYPIMRLKFMRKRFESIGISALIAYVYTIAISAAYPASEWWTFAGMGRWIAQRYVYPEYDWLLPTWMVPPTDVVQVTIAGGAMEWGSWLPSIMFFWIFNLSFSLFSISLATIFRKRWIDVEQVPFPQTLISYDMMKRASGLARLTRPFLIGILIGIVAQLPITFTMLFPWFPDIYGWRVNTCNTGAAYLLAGTPLAAIVGLEGWNKQPLLFAIAYLAPLATQFSVVFFWAVGLVLSQVTYAMGYYTGLADKSGCGRNWCPPTPFWSAPLGFKMWSFVGGSMGITLMMVYQSRYYIASTFKKAFGKGSDASEEGEPMSYRWSYLMLFASFIFIIVFCMVCFDMSLFVAILMPISVFLFWFANIRIVGMSGVYSTCGTADNVLYRWFVWPTIDKPYTREMIFANGISSWHQGTGAEGPGAMGSIFSAFMAYKMSSLVGADNRNVFKVMLASLVLAPLAALFGYVWVINAYGVTRLSPGGDVTSWNPASWIEYTGGIPTWPSEGSVMDWTPSVFVGILAVVALSVLHSRFVWFPLEPVGFWVAFAYSGQLVGMWLPFAVAWVLKFVTLRIGGSKVYEETGIPVATGAAAGCFISILIGAILGIIRFYVPY